MEIAALIVSILAIMISAWAAWYGRGQKLAADESAAAAKRSADSGAELVAIERSRRADEEAAARRVVVDFQLINDGTDIHILVNHGIETAYGVRVDVPRGHGPQEIDEFPPGHRARYITPHHRPIAVTWHARSDLSDPAQTTLVSP